MDRPWKIFGIRPLLSRWKARFRNLQKMRSKAHTTCPWTLTIPEVGTALWHEPRCYSMLIPKLTPPCKLGDSEMTPTIANYSNISRNTPILLAFFECFGTPFPSRPPGQSPWSSGFDGSLHGFQGRAGQSCGAVPSAFRPILDRKPWGPDRWKSVKPMGFTGMFWPVIQWEGPKMTGCCWWCFGRSTTRVFFFVVYPNPHGSPKNISNWLTQTENIVWNYEKFRKDRQFQVDASLKNQVHRLELASIKAINLYKFILNHFNLSFHNKTTLLWPPPSNLPCPRFLEQSHHVRHLTGWILCGRALSEERSCAHGAGNRVENQTLPETQLPSSKLT